MPTSDTRMPVSTETRELVKERKRDGQTYDDYIRVLMGVETPANEGHR